MIMNDYIYMIV